MSKVQRNDPCPCGSGKKYKKCCEPKSQGIRKRKYVQKTGSLGFHIPGANPTKSLASHVFKVVQSVVVPKEKPQEEIQQEEAHASSRGYQTLEELIGLEDGNKDASPTP